MSDEDYERYDRTPLGRYAPWGDDRSPIECVLCREDVEALDAPTLLIPLTPRLPAGLTVEAQVAHELCAYPDETRRSALHAAIDLWVAMDFQPERIREMVEARVRGVRESEG